MYPTCKTTNHRLLYISLLLRRGHEKDYKLHKSGYPSLVYSKMDQTIRGNAMDVQVSQVLVLPTPVIGLPENVCLHDV